MYSRVGFVHQFRPLSGLELQGVIEHQWLQLGLEMALYERADAGGRQFIQMPFDAAQPVHLHTSVGLSTAEPPGIAPPGIRVTADSPLRLLTQTAAPELHLELHADHRQWCVKATDASGGPPLGPARCSPE